MSFAVPAALMLAAIALPIIALYILKVRLRRTTVSTNLFWKQIYEEKPPRAWWQNLRHWMSLLAQLFLLALLVLAVADPYFYWQALQARRIVVVIDTSASMQATDVSPSRFEAARSAVHLLLDGLRFRDEVAIVSAGPEPEVVVGMASHTPTLRRALDSIMPSDTTASLTSAIETAKQLIGDHPNGRIAVFSDGCSQRVDDLANFAKTPKPAQPSGADVTSSDTVQVSHHTFATSAANIGITQLQARRSLIDPLGYELLVTLQNASPMSIKGRLELALDEIPVDVIPFELKPNEVWTRSIEKTSLEGGVLHASLTQLQLAMDDKPENSSDAINQLTTDDEAWAILPQREVQDVLIVSPGNLFLRKVFEANPLVNVNVVKQLPEQWPADTIVVLHRLIPQTLPAGKVLVIDPESDSNAWTLGELIDNPIVTQQDQDSLLMTHIRLDNVLLPQARKISFNAAVTELAGTVTGETVYGLLKRPEGPCLVLSVNLEQSDLAFRTSFPIMMTNALSWFAGRPAELEPSLAGGQLARLSSTAGDFAADPSLIRQRDLRLRSPTGKESAVVSAQVGPLSTIGVWQVVKSTDTNAAGEVQSVQRIAVNLASAQETDLRPTADAVAAQEHQHLLAGAILSRPLWFYLIVAACLFCATEWVLYQRRVIS